MQTTQQKQLLFVDQLKTHSVDDVRNVLDRQLYFFFLFTKWHLSGSLGMPVENSVPERMTELSI